MKIPPQAKKVFTGVMFDVYQWEQEMFDGSKETYEAVKRPYTVQIIALQGDHVLISSEVQPGRPPFLTLFGGRMEEGEDPLEAAKRELREESGLESDQWELLHVFQSPIVKIDWDLYLYVAHDCRKSAETHLDAGEKIEVKSLSYDEFVDTLSSKDFRGRELMYELLKPEVTLTQRAQFKKRLFGEK